MGKIVSNFFISLDGVVESPHEWHFPYFNDEMGAAVGAGVQSTAAFLLGRVLYSEWSEYWPDHADDEQFGRFINNVPKYVVSRSLDGADWNNTTVVRPEVDALRALKERTDGDISLSGSATTVRWLLAAGLLDELNLLIHPIAVGHGQRLFEDTPTQPLTLVRNSTFSTGVIHAVYVPAS